MSFAGTDRNAGTDTATDRESEKWKPLSLKRIVDMRL
jgi:hypothetical protein